MSLIGVLEQARLNFIPFGSELAENYDYWWRADSGLNLSGSLVNSWSDSKSNAIISSSAKPTFVSNWQGNLPAIRFTGSQYLQSSALANFNNQIFTCFFVIENNSTATEVIFRTNYTSGSPFHWGFYTGSNTIFWHSRDSTLALKAVSAVLTNNTKLILCGSWRSNNDVILNYQNQQELNSQADSNPSGFNFFRLGANSGSSIANYWKGYISDLLIYCGQELTVNQIQNNFVYLANLRS